MAFLDMVKEVITNKPSHLKSPYFAKADSDLKTQLEILQEFYLSAPDKIKNQVDQDIRNLEAGRVGEENVAFELENSYMPIIVLHDLNLEYEGLKAQIDFLVITAKFTMIIECKNLYGDIEVNANGDFIRTTFYQGKSKREGIYSPITQNKRHLELIKVLRGSTRGNFLTRAMFEKGFDENYKSVIVLANPKTVLNMKYAGKEIKNQIIRCDQLIGYMKQLYSESRSELSFEKHMFELADYFTNLHKPNKNSFLEKYIKTEQSVPAPILPEILTNEINIETTPIYIELKKYRLDTSRVEGIKAFYIYSNDQLISLISAKPKSIDALMKVRGFDQIKCQKYGNAILDIIRKHA